MRLLKPISSDTIYMAVQVTLIFAALLAGIGVGTLILRVL